jgi:hypothetical protein
VRSTKNCLDIRTEEVGFEKYLSREAREQIGMEKRADEERLRAMNADDTNQRALAD